MREQSPQTSAYFKTRAGFISKVLVWVRARNRATGAEETLGLWTGGDHQSFLIRGQTRLYYGAGAVLDVPPITMTTGTVIQMQQISLSPLTSEVTQLFRSYDARLAPIEIHQALFDPDTMQLIDTPEQRFKGWIDTAQIPRPELGGDATITVTLAPVSRELTRTLAIKKSHATQQLRGGDGLFRHIAVTGEISTAWGEA